MQKTRIVARIILLDPMDRILLFGGRNPDDGRIVWIMPGGGVEPGESVAEAASRELFEETGLRRAAEEFVGPVWRREHCFSWDGRSFDYLEWYVLARLPEASAVVPFAGDPAEAKNFVAARWVDPAALRAWPDPTAPRRLAELLPDLLEKTASELEMLRSSPVDTGV